MLKEYLNEFIIVYLNNIIIYSNTKGEHKQHIEWVLKTLSKENIPIAIKKCKFHTKKTDFVKFVIKLKLISIDPKKIKAIINWQDLESVTGLRSFLRFCNYYRRFIRKWSDKTEPFTRITKKNKP